MARGISKVILIGNLGRDPETRYSQAGNAVTKFSLATSDSWRDRESGEQPERTEWHNIVCLARLAETAGQYLRKGSKVYIEGSLSTSSWEQDGQKRPRTEVIARDYQMLDRRSADAGLTSGFEHRGAPAPTENQPVPNAPTHSTDDDFEDDIRSSGYRAYRLREIPVPAPLRSSASL